MGIDRQREGGADEGSSRLRQEAEQECVGPVFMGLTRRVV